MRTVDHISYIDANTQTEIDRDFRHQKGINKEGLDSDSYSTQAVHSPCGSGDSFLLCLSRKAWTWLSGLGTWESEKKIIIRIRKTEKELGN